MPAMNKTRRNRNRRQKQVRTQAWRTLLARRTFTSTQDGDWHAPETWGRDRAPGVGDTVNILHSVEVRA